MKRLLKDLWFPVFVMIVLISAWVTYNELIYDDWKCAFSRCVRVEDVKP